MYKKSNRIICMGLMLCMTSAMILGGCGQKNESSGKIEIELVQYKPEAVKTFEKIEEEFNATHDDIHLTIESPNDAMTVLKTRFIREDAPDIIGIGGNSRKKRRGSPRPFSVITATATCTSTLGTARSWARGSGSSTNVKSTAW